MSQLGFYYNVDRCTGCKTCQIACKDVQDTAVGALFREVLQFESGRFPQPVAYMVSMACNHCALPACLASCTAGAISKDLDGRVLIDPEICIGCQSCVSACPYSAPCYIEADGQTRKCDLCFELVSQGEEPACVASCLMRAIEYGDIEELRAPYGNNADCVGLPSSETTKPSIVINMHRSLR